MLKAPFLKMFLCLCLGMTFVSCKQSGGLEVNEFDPFTNLHTKTNDTIYALSADLSDAVLNGIEIPTKKQTTSGYFVFTFKVKNNSSDIKRFYYKIFYQNQSYKFSDDHEFASENFYGSWAEGRYTFKPTKILSPGEEIFIKDSFNIVGNPRNEKKYFGPDLNRYEYTADSINAKMARIRTVTEWMEQITKKARSKQSSVEKELYSNALWLIDFEKERSKPINNRWKRNPRMGFYDVMLVVTSPEDFGTIPMEVRNIQLTNKVGEYTNAFAYFSVGEGSKLLNTQIAVSKKKLKVSSSLDLGAGIYVDKLNNAEYEFSPDSFSNNCGNTLELNNKAHFSQYFHSINKDYTVYNIPEIRDVTGESLSRKEYEGFVSKYENKDKRVKMFVNITKCPCATVKSNPETKKLTVLNPAANSNNYRKEHVGVAGRIGFTYGKFRAKIKFPEMLSSDNVWNGITNAFWLLCQGGEWNNRRPCDSDKGYLPKSAPDNNEAFELSQKTLDYSEIDFEIVKESQYWPKTSYKHANVSYKTDDPYNNKDIMVTCTNWDMSCHEPSDYDIGAREYTIDGKKFIVQRWNSYYKALSAKIPANHDKLFKQAYYYFEIDWQPERIIWKIGPEKNQLETICIMTSEFTSIPNNQMRPMVTQEWHNEEWWPTAPFKQNFIPFPKKNIVGEILEIEID